MQDLLENASTGDHIMAPIFEDMSRSQVLDENLPDGTAAVPFCLDDLVVEVDLFIQVVFVRNVFEVLEDFGGGRVAVRSAVSLRKLPSGIL